MGREEDARDVDGEAGLCDARGVGHPAPIARRKSFRSHEPGVHLGAGRVRSCEEGGWGTNDLAARGTEEEDVAMGDVDVAVPLGDVVVALESTVAFVVSNDLARESKGTHRTRSCWPIVTRRLGFSAQTARPLTAPATAACQTSSCPGPFLPKLKMRRPWSIHLLGCGS